MRKLCEYKYSECDCFICKLISYSCAIAIAHAKKKVTKRYSYAAYI